LGIEQKIDEISLTFAFNTIIATPTLNIISSGVAEYWYEFIN
jgi:hypothetical protein